MTARDLADKIYGTQDLKDISEFNISLDSAVNMMETYAGKPIPIVSGSALLADLLKAQKEIISDPRRFTGVAIEDIKRIFANYGIEYQSTF